MTTLRQAAEQALKVMAVAERLLRYENLYPFVVADLGKAHDTLRAALQREALNEVHQMDHEEFFRRDEIIRMAQEAGMERTGLYWHCNESELVRVAVNVINREREACARLCEREHDPAYAARAIRARSKP